MKGIILAGGTGSRLYPLTLSISKQLLPVYDKPMIYYPLATLMRAGIRDILIISTARDIDKFKELFNNGKHLGIHLEFISQPEPGGIPQAFIMGEKFIGNDDVTLILGDNIFHGSDINLLPKLDDNAVIFVYTVKNPNRYGVIDYEVTAVDYNYDKIDIKGIVEKPVYFVSNKAVTGLYQYPNDVISYSKDLSPSNRNELEITDINNIYINRNKMKVMFLSRDTVWLDAGTHNSLHQASSYVKTIQDRSGIMIGCIEEIAWRNGWISSSIVEEQSKKYNNEYGEYLHNILQGE